ncbi:MAG: hypothetical protein ABIZ80_22460, partial [Bryobacteraceae bacterium]
LGLAIALSICSAILALRTGVVYRFVLEQGLVRRAREEGNSDDRGESMLNTVFDGLPSMPEMRLATEPDKASASAPPAPAAALRDRSAVLLGELRSQDLRRVLGVLESAERLDMLLVPQVIRLLAWDEASGAARAFLERGASGLSGQLSDALLDPEVDFAIRRRIPRLLARSGTQRSVEALLQGLRDARFEVRFQCGRALDHLKRQYPDLEFRETVVLASVARELSVGKSIWRSWRSIDKRDSTDDYNFLDELLKGRADQSLEHVFSLLALILPRGALMAAFRALHQEDRVFRGLALEYLENVLPEEIRQRLWVILEEAPPALARDDAGQPEQVLEELLRSNATLVQQWHELRPDSPKE